MSSLKIDRRIVRTRRELQTALMELILEKGYDAITVEEITERADVGRATFYLHFHDKGELLLKSVDDIADELKSQIGIKDDQDFNNRKPARVILAVFRHAAEHAALYQIILNGGAAIHVINRYQEIVSEMAVNFFERKKALTGQSPQISSEMLASYFAVSLIGLVVWWLKREMPESPEEIANTFMLLFYSGVKDMGNPIMTAI